MPLNEYWLERPINVIRGQRHLVVSAGRYQTSDPDDQRILAGYPGVQFVCSKTAPVDVKDPKQAADESLAKFGYAPEPVVVTNQVGLQIRERKPTLGARIVER